MHPLYATGRFLWWHIDSYSLQTTIRYNARVLLVLARILLVPARVLLVPQRTLTICAMHTYFFLTHTTHSLFLLPCFLRLPILHIPMAPPPAILCPFCIFLAPPPAILHPGPLPGHSPYRTSPSHSPYLPPPGPRWSLLAMAAPLAPHFSPPISQQQPLTILTTLSR